MDGDSQVKNHYVFGILSVLPQCMNAVYHLGHVFAIIHICRLGIEYLKAETTTGISHSSFIGASTLLCRDLTGAHDPAHCFPHYNL